MRSQPSNIHMIPNDVQRRAVPLRQTSLLPVLAPDVKNTRHALTDGAYGLYFVGWCRPILRDGWLAAEPVLPSPAVRLSLRSVACLARPPRPSSRLAFCRSEPRHCSREKGRRCVTQPVSNSSTFRAPRCLLEKTADVVLILPTHGLLCGREIWTGVGSGNRLMTRGRPCVGDRVPRTDAHGDVRPSTDVGRQSPLRRQARRTMLCGRW